MAATCFLSIRPSSSSSLIATHHRASAPSSKRPVSWPSSNYSFSAPIRLLLRKNTVLTPEEDLDDYGYGFNFYGRKPFGTVLSAETLCCNVTTQIQPRKPTIHGTFWKPKTMVASILVLGVGLALTPVGPASAVELPILGSLQLSEPSNALSLPTWAVHVSSVVEWITAMVLVWQYGEKSGNESWKGLSWGMVPLLGGAFCACTWHFFYNSESLEVLVALQAALTAIGNATMCYAAFRICKASEERSKNNLSRGQIKDK